MKKVRPLGIILIILSVVQQAAGYGAARGSSAARAPQAGSTAADAAASRRMEAFEIVWGAVKENHFDPNFGGLDWDAVRAEFAPLVGRARSDREAHALLQQMLNRLGQSHFNIIPPEFIPSAEGEAWDEDEGGDEGAEEPGAEKRRAPGSLEMTERLTYGIGIDLRVIAGAAVITRVEPGSTAARAGLRTGFVLRSIDGYGLRTILRELKRAAVYEPSARHQIPAEILVGFVNGPQGTSVRLTYADGAGRIRRAVVARERLRGEMSPALRSMPSQFYEFESRRLRNGVGYLRFNLFVPPVMDKFCAALRSMKDAPGVVLDLRGNRGGLIGLIYGMGGLLETREASFGVMRTRAGWYEFRVTPQSNPYRGRLVVLIDSTTLSAAEIFAGGLQESGRAVVIGERSAGATLPSVAKELPTGAILQYAFADFVTAYGNVLEGRGVIPDVPVKLDRRALLAGRDPQLEAAIDAVETRPHARTLGRAPAPPPITVNVGPPAREENGVGAKADAVGAAGSAAGAAGVGIGPEVEAVLERYVEAVGGRAALEKLSSRSSRGTFEGAFAGVGVSGAVEVFEKAPDKSVTLVHVPGLGVMRRGYTGAYAYQQIPLFGFRRVEGVELADARAASEFRWPLELRRLYPRMVVKGRERVGESDAVIVEATPERGSPTMLYFDTRTGLLVRRDKTYFEDYREVDGVKLPFVVRDPFSVTTLTEVKHNVAIEDARFAEERNCFTQ